MRKIFTGAALMLAVGFLAACGTGSTPDVPPAAGPTATAQPTREPTPTLLVVPMPTRNIPTPRPPTATPTAAPLSTDPDILALYDNGAVPYGASARLGIGSVHAAAFSPDDSLLAIGTTVGVYVYQVSPFRQLWGIATRAPADDVFWSPDGAMVGSRLSDGRHLIWRASDAELLHRGDEATTVANQIYYPRYAAEHAEDENKVLLTERVTGEVVETFWPSPSPIGSHGVIGPLVHTSFSPDGNWLAMNTGICCYDTPGGDPRIFLWSLLSGEQVHLAEDYLSLPGRTMPVESVSWSPDSARFASAAGYFDAGGMVIIWDLATRAPQHILRFDTPAALVNWSPQKNLVAIELSDSPKSSTIIVNADSGEIARQWNDLQGWVGTLAWSHDARLLFTATGLQFKLLDAATGNQLAQGYGDLEIRETLFAPDSQQVAIERSEYSHYDHSLWNANDGRIAGAVPHDQHPVESGGCLGKSGDYWTITSVGTCETPIKAEFSGNIEYYYDDSNYFTIIEIIDVTSREVLLSHTEDGVVPHSAAFSPDTSMLAVGFGTPACNGCPYLNDIDTSYVLLLNLETGEARRLYGHTGWVTSVNWSPDGAMLVSGSMDGTALLWPITD